MKYWSVILAISMAALNVIYWRQSGNWRWLIWTGLFLFLGNLTFILTRAA